MICLLLVNYRADSQNIEEIISFGDSLFRLKNNIAALNEYHRAFFFTNNKEGKAEISKKIACCYLTANQLSLAYAYYDSALYYSSIDSSKIGCELDKILCIILEKDFAYGLKLLDGIETCSNDYPDRRKKLYKGLCCFGLERYDEAFIYFFQIIPQNDSSLTAQLYQLYDGRKKLMQPYPAVAITMSVFVPGSGQVYAGNLKDGINSLALLSALAYIALLTPVLDFFVILPFFYRYYVGGILNANELAKDRKIRKQSACYTDLTKIYELDSHLNSLFSLKDGTQNYSVYLENSASEINVLLSFSFLFYKKYVSSQDIDACVFEPSCSVYTIETIQKNGIAKGFLDGLDRLLRCHSFVNEHEYSYNIYTKRYYDPL